MKLNLNFAPIPHCAITIRIAKKRKARIGGAVSGERTLPALDAAHIKPFADGGAHEASNGILLRRDIHSLFDAGYVTITPQLKFEVSTRIKEEFENGRHYYELHGHAIAVPDNPTFAPDVSALSWHNEWRFY